MILNLCEMGAAVAEEMKLIRVSWNFSMRGGYTDPVGKTYDVFSDRNRD